MALVRTELAHLETVADSGFTAGIVHEESDQLVTSLNLAPNTLLVAVVACTPNGSGQNDLRINSSPDLEWTARINIGGGYRAMKVFTAIFPDGGNIDVTGAFAWGGNKFINGILNINGFTGYDPANPIGGLASESIDDVWGGSSWDVTSPLSLSSAPATSSIVLSLFFGGWDNGTDVDDSTKATIETSSGFTEIRYEGVEVSSIKAKFKSQYRTGSTSSSISQRWYGNTDYAALRSQAILEIVADSSTPIESNGTLSVTEASDTVSSNSKIATTALLSLSESNDSILATSSLEIKGNLSGSEFDAMAAQSFVLVQSQLEISENSDGITSKASLADDSPSKFINTVRIKSVNPIPLMPILKTIVGLKKKINIVFKPD